MRIINFDRTRPMTRRSAPSSAPSRAHSHSHVYRRCRQVLVIASLCAAAASTLGCSNIGNSRLERGETISSNSTQFDRYFEQVADLKEEVDNLDSDLLPMRKPLTQEMNLDVDISMRDLFSATRRRVLKYKSQGTTLNLRLTPAPKVIVAREKAKEDEKAPKGKKSKKSRKSDDQKQLEDTKNEPLLLAIEEAAGLSLDLFKEYELKLEKLSELDNKRGMLADKIDRLAPDVNKSLIETEIVAAGRVLDAAGEKLTNDSQAIAHFMIGLAGAVDSGASSTQQAQCDEALIFFAENKNNKKKKKRWVGKGRPKPARPAGDFEM